MKAYLHSVRIAPKKLNLMAKMIRGMTVPDAVELLRRTHKKSARIVETLLRSAIANASHNDKQDPQMLIVKTLVVNQGTALRRGVPMARGRQRPMRKFMSHLTLALGVAEEEESSSKKSKKVAKAKSVEKSSQTAKNPVKKNSSSSKKTDTPSDSSPSKVSA